MQNKNKNKHKPKLLITTILTLALTTACSTTTKRDQKIIEVLQDQNSAISASLDTNPNLKTEDSQSTNNQRRTLVAVLNSNKVIINKLKPTPNKECNCGKNEKPND